MSLRALLPALFLLTGCWEVTGGESGSATLGDGSGTNAGGNGNGNGNGGSDSGTSNGGGGGAGGDGGDGGDGGSSVASCSYDDYDICFAVEGYDNLQTWCSDTGAEYGISTTYAARDCPGGAVQTCAIPAGEDLESPTTAHYYSPSYDASSAATACANAGGTVGG